VITTVAGNGNSKVYGDGGQAVAAQLGSVGELALDGSGNLYFCDTGGGRVRMINSGGNIYTIGGGAGTYPASFGGPATDLGLQGPFGVVSGSGGSLYVSDGQAGIIWLLTPSSTPVYPMPPVVQFGSAGGFYSNGAIPTSVALGGWMEI
jgi:hypothetical protein